MGHTQEHACTHVVGIYSQSSRIVPTVNIVIVLARIDESSQKETSEKSKKMHRDSRNATLD